MDHYSHPATENTQLLLGQDREGYAEGQDNSGDQSALTTARARTSRFLSSKVGHYAVIFLVSVDVACIFADFLISLYLCERECGGKESTKYETLHDVQDALEIASLVFSSLFMVELIASVWAFGFHFFTSWFHCLDASVIIAGFVLDVVLKGTLQEVGATVVVLRLWRVFKIIEEFSTGASERMETLNEHIEQLEKENKDLRHELTDIKRIVDQGGSMQS